jgi:hypothetical protein
VLLICFPEERPSPEGDAVEQMARHGVDEDVDLRVVAGRRRPFVDRQPLAPEPVSKPLRVRAHSW